MPIRIYALAKELGKENKELVDICERIGIKGKGSALASLNEDEEKKVKDFISKALESAAPSSAASGKSNEPKVLRREDVVPARTDKKIRDLNNAKSLKRSTSSVSDDSVSNESEGSVALEEPVLSNPESETVAESTENTETAVTKEPAPTTSTTKSPLQSRVKKSDTDSKTESVVADSSKTSQPGSAKSDTASDKATVSDQAETVKAETVKTAASPLERPKSSKPAAKKSEEPAPAAKSEADSKPAPLQRPSVRQSPLDRMRSRTEAQSKDEKQKRKPKEKKKPTVRLAAMPAVKQPVAKKAEPKERVQKPDIALPIDAIRARTVSGDSAPLKQFTKSSQNKLKKVDPSKKFVGGEEETKEKDKRGKGGRNTNKDRADSGMGSVRQRRPRGPSRHNDDRGGYRPRSRYGRKKKKGSTAAPRKEDVALEVPCTIRAFSEAAGVPAGNVIKALLEMGTMATINHTLDEENALFLAETLGVSINFKQPETLEESLIETIEESEDDDANLVTRPPVVTFLGHVDHGKTSLLDALIGINVVSGEAGGITQHIRAYSIEKGDQRISFVDTPGHEAFTEMRARGANVTDIAVLVVAADDGVMPQTEEAISHAKAAGVPIIVALNKIDIPGANPDKALQDLATRDLLPSEWGGDIEVIKTSATRGDGLDTLLDTILVTAELNEYKANPDRAAFGTCLEAEQEPGKGVIAKIIVQNGTLNVGDVVVCGAAHGRVKAMNTTLGRGQRVKTAGPSIPVNITGLDVAPEAGDRFYVLDEISDAREIAEQRLIRSREQSLTGRGSKEVSLEEFQRRLETGTLTDDKEDVVTLNLIIRADVRGSIEAILKELEKLEHPEVEIKILQAAVGGITHGDVTLASASSAVIIGFNVVPNEDARILADAKSVEIRRYDIIYKVTDDIRATLEGRLKPEKREVELGMAMVLRTFTISRIGTIAGCRVMRGTIERDCRIRVIRDSRVIGDYALDTLRREKDDAKEVRQGMECGIKLGGYNDIKEADSLEAYKIEEVARTL